VTTGEVNEVSPREFLHLLGGVYEHSLWVAEAVLHARPFASRDSLRDSMRLEVERAGRDRQLAILRAHPDLGTKAKIGVTSASEQKNAGLDQLQAGEYERLTELNRRYTQKFGFPFIFAVRGRSKQDVLAAIESRTGSGPEEEFLEALRQVHRIAAFRLEDLIEDQ
jgi:2-oxo-4-hydroxy-4-carboxy-5-ureidoimidazoline decarboxylase